MRNGCLILEDKVRHLQDLSPATPFHNVARVPLFDVDWNDDGGVGRATPWLKGGGIDTAGGGNTVVSMPQIVKMDVWYKNVLRVPPGPTKMKPSTPSR